MEGLYLFQEQIIRATSFLFRRDCLDQIEWNERLIGLIGARGVGKTTLMLQHLTENISTREESLYITIDNLANPIDSLYSLAESFYKLGGKRLYIDAYCGIGIRHRVIKNINREYNEDLGHELGHVDAYADPTNFNFEETSGNYFNPSLGFKFGVKI